MKFPDHLFPLAGGTLKPHNFPQILVTRKLVNSVQNAPSPDTLGQCPSKCSNIFPVKAEIFSPDSCDTEEDQLLRLAGGAGDHVEEELVLPQRLRQMLGLEPAPGPQPRPALDDEVGQVSVVVVDHPEQRVPVIT